MPTGAGHGPDLKARTDLAERIEKARIEARKNRTAPEHLPGQMPAPKGEPERPGIMRRVVRRLLG